MQASARDNYLLTEIMTATPQKLQLMLIDAALRFGQQAREHWQAGRDDEAGEAIVRCQQIMAQLLGGMKPELNRDLVQRVAAVYLFVFNCFITAHLNRDEKQLDDALSVLTVEQQTWREVCAQLGSTRDQVGTAVEGVTLEG